MTNVTGIPEKQPARPLPALVPARVKFIDRRAFRINVVVIASLLGLTLVAAVGYLAVTLQAWNTRTLELEGVVADLEVQRDESNTQARDAEEAREQSEIDLLAALEAELLRRYEVELAEEFAENYDFQAPYLIECAHAQNEHIDFVLQIGYYTYSSVRSVGNTVNAYCRDIDADFDGYIATEAAELAELAALKDAP